MDATSNIATDLFYKIRSRFTGLKLGENTGAITINPESARFFDFDYTEGGKNIGHVSISLAEPNSMKVYFSTGITEGMDGEQKTNWYAFLKELRMFAKRRMLAFDTRDIAKDNLDRRDYAFLSQHSVPHSDNDTITKPVGETVMNENNLYGTKTQSFQKLMDTRLIIKHSKKLADDFEQKPGDRSRNISALFVENQDGERFKYPFIHLAGARAMQRHVANGGLPYDTIGESIIRMSEEIAQLKSFTNYCVRNDLMNSDTNNIVERSKAQLEGLRERIARLSKQAHYENYVTEFQAPEAFEVPDDVMEDYKEKFTVKNFKEDLTSIFPVLYKLMKEEENVGYDDIVGMTEADEETEQEQKVSEDPMASFETWVNNLGEQSPIVSADGEEKADIIKKLNGLIDKHFPAGVDGTNAIQSLHGIIEDPELDSIIKNAAKEDSEQCVRPMIKSWIEKNAPEIMDELDFGDMVDTVEKTQESSGSEGQAEPHRHTIDIEGDYDEDRGIGETECEMMEKQLAEKGIKAACEPNELRQGSVIIHTMSDKESVIKALAQSGYQAEAFEDQVAEGGNAYDLAITDGENEILDSNSEEEAVKRLGNLMANGANADDSYANDILKGMIERIKKQGLDKTQQEISMSEGDEFAQAVKQMTVKEKDEPADVGLSPQARDYEEKSDDEEDTGFTDKQIKMAYGVLNDPKYRQGNYDGAVEVINKIAPGLADHPGVANALKRANEGTVEASGYEGQDEYHAHIIRLNGDFDAERPVSDADAELVKQTIMKNSGKEGRSILVDVEPAEDYFDSVVVHSARSKEEIISYLGDMVEEDAATEGNEFAKKVQDLKAQGAKKGTKFKTSDGEEHTLETVAEFIHSFYDRNTATFPKGPEGVCTMVGKKYGEQAEQIARKMVERMAPHQEQGAEEIEELERIKNLIKY
jgi:chorismate mutase